MDFRFVSDHMSKKLQAILPAIAGSHPHPPEGIPTVDLSLAENVLLGEEVLGLAKAAISDFVTLEDLSYPTGFGGGPELLSALARFLNTYFHPSIIVQPDHIIPTSGAGNALDALLCTICDPGDVVLVLGPCWEGFGPYFLIHANVKPVVVTASTLEGATEADITEALKNAYDAVSEKQRIKAVVVTNPNNPLGRCYPAEVLRDIILFCHAHGMHLISDEVYAMSSIMGSGSCSRPFVSALSLLDGQLNTDIASLAPRVHVVWSMSKDFGCSGIRMGCIVSQANPALRLGSGLATYWQTSSLTSVVVTSLLTSPQLTDLMHQNSERLGAAYRQLTDGLERLHIQYIPADYGLFVLARVGANCQNFEEETTMGKALAQRGLILAPGRKFSCGKTECGWFRITFSTSAEKIDMALKAIEAVLGGNQ